MASGTWPRLISFSASVLFDGDWKVTFRCCLVKSPSFWARYSAMWSGLGNQSSRTVVLVMAVPPLLLAEEPDEDDEPHATTADIRAAAPRTSAPRLRPARLAVMDVTVSLLVPKGRRSARVPRR